MNREVATRPGETATRTTRHEITRGAIRLVAFVIALGSFGLTAFAADGGNGKARRSAKVAPDLARILERRSPAEIVQLIVRVNKGKAHLIGERVAGLQGKINGHYKHVGAMVIEVPLGAVEQLTAIDAIGYIAPDRPVQGVMSALQRITGASQVYPATAGEGLAGVDGSGIGVAILDSGIEFNRFDLRTDTTRILFSADFTGKNGPKDQYGHGTHVAGLIAGNGFASRQAGRDYSGIAPNAGLVDLKVLDAHGRGSVSGVIAAIDFAIANRETFNIRVLNLSLAAPPVESYRDDPLCRAVARATDAGIVVVVAAGNFGMDENGEKVYGGIASPGISPEAITIGAAHTLGTIPRSDDTVAPFSSRGPTMSGSVDPDTGEVVHDNLPKPDLVAPGVALVSLQRHGNYLVREHPEIHVDTGKNGAQDLYMALSGTSAAAGVVSGTVALMLQSNPSLTPNLVKAILMYSAQILDGPDLFEQGAGELNVEGAVRIAQSISQDAGDLEPGDELAIDDLPDPALSTIAGEPVVWSQGLIWGTRWVYGSAVFGELQEAYAQGLIWGTRYTVWGAGIVMYDGLYVDDQVLFGQNGEWHYATWDEGVALDSGALVRQPLSRSGVSWRIHRIPAEFFAIEPSGLIWGFRNVYGEGLIWGVRLVYAEGLIWGVRAYTIPGGSYPGGTN